MVSRRKIMTNYFDLIAAARADGRLLPSEKNAYAVILELSYKEGFCFATNRYIAAKIGMSDRTVKRAVSRLAVLGYINITREADFCGIITRRLYPVGAAERVTEKDKAASASESSAPTVSAPVVSAKNSSEANPVGKDREVLSARKNAQNENDEETAMNESAFKRAKKFADRLVKEGYDKAMEYIRKEKSTEKEFGDFFKSMDGKKDPNGSRGGSRMTRGWDAYVAEGRSRPVSMEYMVFNINKINKKINKLLNNRGDRETYCDRSRNFDNFEHYKRGADYYKGITVDNDRLDSILG